MPKPKVEKYAETEVLKGTSHQKIFDHIISTSKFNIHDVADIVRKIPTLEKRKKYKSINNTLLLIIGLIIVDRIILMYEKLNLGEEFVGIAFLFPILSIVLFYAIYKYKRNAHLSSGFLFVFASFEAIIRIITQQDIFSIINVTITLLGAFISFYLSVKLVSDYFIDKEQQNSNPTQRENLITFIDK